MWSLIKDINAAAAMPPQRAGWQRCLSGLGNVAQMAVGGLWIYASFGWGAVLGGGFLIARGAEGLYADITETERYSKMLARQITGSSAAAEVYDVTATFAEIVLTWKAPLKPGPTVVSVPVFTVKNVNLATNTGKTIQVPMVVIQTIEVTQAHVLKGLALSGAGGRLVFMKASPNETAAGRPGQPGSPDHIATVKRLRERAEKEFKGRRVVFHESTSIKKAPNARGLDRRPDVWVEDQETGEVLKI